MKSCAFNVFGYTIVIGLLVLLAGCQGPTRLYDCEIGTPGHVFVKLEVQAHTTDEATAEASKVRDALVAGQHIPKASTAECRSWQ